MLGSDDEGVLVDHLPSLSFDFSSPNGTGYSGFLNYRCNNGTRIHHICSLNKFKEIIKISKLQKANRAKYGSHRI